MAETTEQSLKGDNIEVVVSRSRGSKVKLDVIMAPELVNDSYKKAVKAVNKEVILPGFRKGKAPDAMIERHYGKAISEEWKDVIIREGLARSCELAEVRPFTRDVEFSSLPPLNREEPAQFSISFEVAPEMPQNIDYSDLQLKPEEIVPPTDEEIDKYINDLGLKTADWEDIKEDRAVQEDDYVTIEAQHVSHPQFTFYKNEIIQVTKDYIPDWLHSILVGRRVNETFEGETDQFIGDLFFPYLKPKNENEKSQVKITVKSILRPNVNQDKIAKQLGVENPDNIREAITSHLTKIKQEDKRREFCEKIGDALLEKYPIDVPETVVEEMLSYLWLYNLLSLLPNNPTEKFINDYKEYSIPELRGKAERIAHLYLISFIVAKDNQIELKEQEINAHAFYLYFSMTRGLPLGNQYDQIMDMLKASARRFLLNDRVLSLIADRLEKT